MQVSIDYIGIGTGGILTNKEGEILLLNRKKAPESGYWSIPGGTVEFGETAEEAIVREFKEETGLLCCPTHFLGYYDYILLAEHRHWLSLFFIMANKGYGEPINMEPNKHSQMQWFNLDKLPGDLTKNTTKAITLYKEWIKKILQT